MMRLFFLILPLMIGCAGGQKIVDSNRSNIPEKVTPDLETTPFSISLGIIFSIIVLTCVYYLLKSDKSDSSD